MRHLRKFLALSVSVLALGFAACDVVVQSMEGGREKASREWTKTYTLAEGDTFQIDNTNGRIEVEGTDRPEYEVHATITARASSADAARELLGQVEVDEDRTGDGIRIKARYPKSLKRSGVEVQYTVRVPKRARLGLETVNGGISLSGLSGTVTAQTVNGGVKGRDLSATLKASSTNGGIDLSFSEVAAGGLSAETTNGGISIGLPSTAKGTIRARCVNGGIHVDGLPIERVESSRRRVDGTLNGGGPSIEVETVNGGIRFGRS